MSDLFLMLLLAIFSFDGIAILLFLAAASIGSFAVYKILNVIFYGAWYNINIVTSISTDNGKTYNTKFAYTIDHKTYKQDQLYAGNTEAVYLKYEIAAKAHGFLSNSVEHKIGFAMKAPKGTKLCEYSGVYYTKPKKEITKKTGAVFFLYVEGKKTENAKIVLKFSYPAGHTTHRFRLEFLDGWFKKHSKTLALEFNKA